MYILLVLLLWPFTARSVAGLKTTYIIPTDPATELASNCPVNASRCLSLNQLIDSGSRFGAAVFESSEEVIFKSGIHKVNGTQNQYLYANGISNLAFRGESDTIISCKEELVFFFQDIESITISNVHFANCTGASDWVPDFEKSSTLFFADVVHNVIIDSVQITSNGGIGIVLYFEFNLFHAIWLQFHILDSDISTGDIGVYSGGTHESETNLDDDSIHLEIINTSFRTSCLQFETIAFASYTIWKVKFRNCKCSPVLSFIGVHSKIILKEIALLDNESPVLMHASQVRSVIFEGNCFIHRNKGVSIINGSEVFFTDTVVEIANNSVTGVNDIPGSIFFIVNSYVEIRRSDLYFMNNHGQLCGGITATDGTKILVTFISRIDFIRNSGIKGGALSLYKQSVLEMISQGVCMNFHYNTATMGGGIYIEDMTHVKSFSYKLTKSVINIRLFEDNNYFFKSSIQFSNNTALIGGSAIYGGWVDWSVDDNQGIITYNPIMSTIINLQGDDDIASSPLRACLCFDGVPNCTITEYNTSLYPGETFTVDAVVVGQRFGTVSSVITTTNFVTLSHDQRIVNDSQSVQTVYARCTPLYYTITSSNRREILTIRPIDSEITPRFPQELLDTHPPLALLFEQLFISLTIKYCPLAFPFAEDDRKCTCPLALTSLGLGCDIKTFRILRNKQQWVGLSFNHTTMAKSEDTPSVIAHQHCPFDYCSVDEGSLLIDMSYRDEQCAHNRSGVLCGACKAGLSQVLGSSKCKVCSSLFLLAVIPGTLMAGLLLILFLMTLDLTVSHGTINGLIFYANIIEAQHATFFTPYTSHSFLRKFIAWINLDLGIEVCFSHNLDGYTKAWLQFIFPVYIWLLLAVIIVSSHYSTIASRISGNNAVQVLATSFLLSYTKLLRLIVSVFSFAIITYPDGYTKKVWLYDGNLEYMRGKHIPLFMVTLLFLALLSVPYTLTVLSIQWLFKLSRYRVLFWVHQLKPLLDAYTGPYRLSHRYWTGLLLIVRVLLLISFSLNRNNNPATNLFIIMVFSTFLLIWLCFTQWVYKDLLCNCLELLFICNLSITSTALLLFSSNSQLSSVVIFLSTGLTFVVFIGIILYHCQRQLFKTRAGAKFKVKLLAMLHIKKEHTEIEVTPLPANQPPQTVTSTVIELTQPLLEEPKEKEKEC